MATQVFERLSVPTYEELIERLRRDIREAQASSPNVGGMVKGPASVSPKRLELALQRKFRPEPGLFGRVWQLLQDRWAGAPIVALADLPREQARKLGIEAEHRAVRARDSGTSDLGSRPAGRGDQVATLEEVLSIGAPPAPDPRSVRERLKGTGPLYEPAPAPYWNDVADVERTVADDVNDHLGGTLGL